MMWTGKSSSLFPLLVYWLFIRSVWSMTLATDKGSLSSLFAGFDLGTSGARLSIIESSVGNEDNLSSSSSSNNKNNYREVYSQSLTWNHYDDTDAWWNATATLLQGAASSSHNISIQRIQSICISGTSASCLLVDRDTNLQQTRHPRMYNYDIVEAADNKEAAIRALEILDQHVPRKHTARARTGSLAKLLAWALARPLQSSEILCHQSDYISMLLLGPKRTTTMPLTSDWHNCLKLGYDVRNRKWPAWMTACLAEVGISDPTTVIPAKVVAPGEPMGVIDAAVAARLGLSSEAVIVGGTTDSNAAFFAAAGTRPPFGTAVTSLGSTLAMKQLSKTYVEDADRGVYSHRFPNFQNPDQEAWLVGGASNVGCAILRQLDFSNDELKELSAKIDPSTDSPLQYYPLTKIGERFPVADSEKKPILEPVPSSRAEYLHGLLQSIGDVEREGFSILQELGAPPPTTIYTCGGGSNNAMWSALRQRRLQVRFGSSDIHVTKAESTEASYGAALLAAATFA